jgi:hypothetical protein
MRHTLLVLLLCSSVFAFSQHLNLELENKNTGKTTVVKPGDKVLMAIKHARHDVRQKPGSVYRIPKTEATDSQFVFTKGKIKTITDSSIFIKEKNSLFSSGMREVRLEKINTLKRLSFGKQVFRTTTTIAGGVAGAIAIFYSYVATGGGDGFIEGMFVAAGTGAVATRFGRTKILKKHLDIQEIRLARLDP